MHTVNALTALARTIAAAPGLLRVRPSLNAFLAGYLHKFPVSDMDGRLIIHSHLPPLDSRAYARFVRLHLVERVEWPSHAQLAVTNACPQRCDICYNRDRAGVPLEHSELSRVVSDLVAGGVIWLGITGGEPLLRADLPELVALGRDRCAMKLFTTGMGLTTPMALRLCDAGLFSVSVSIDHWDQAIHDRRRGFTGAWRAAVEAVGTFLATGGLHVGISAVLPREAIRSADHVERLLAFADTLGVHELWLSEAKPAVASMFDDELVVREEERREVAVYQDRWNARVRRAKRGVTLNYLGHFEGAEHFGCNAGRKMVYVDPFGEVSPCVFAPFSFGNIREHPLADTIDDMCNRFPTEDRCFMNRNWPLVSTISGGALPMTRAQSLAMLEEVHFRPLSAFNRRYFASEARSPRRGPA